MPISKIALRDPVIENPTRKCYHIVTGNTNNILPVAELSGSTLTVTVGAVEHPMVDVHHIQWLFVETENGGQLRYLAPGQAPKAVFELGSEKPVAVYAYCNLHGLWMTKL